MDGPNRKVVKIGTATVLCAIITSFLPVLYLWVVYGEIPASSQLASTLNMIFVAPTASRTAQPLSYYGGLGMVGTYISWISDPAADIRPPFINMIQKVTNTEANTPKEDAIGVMALSASAFTTVGIVSVFAVVGSRIIPLLPEIIIQSFIYMQPALFAAVFVNMVVKNLKPGLMTLALGLLCCSVLPQLGLSMAWLTLTIVVDGLAIGTFLARRGARKIVLGGK